MILSVYNTQRSNKIKSATSCIIQKQHYSLSAGHDDARASGTHTVDSPKRHRDTLPHTGGLFGTALPNLHIENLAFKYFCACLLVKMFNVLNVLIK